MSSPDDKVRCVITSKGSKYFYQGKKRIPNPPDADQFMCNISERSSKNMNPDVFVSKVIKAKKQQTENLKKSHLATKQKIKKLAEEKKDIVNKCADVATGLKKALVQAKKKRALEEPGAEEDVKFLTEELAKTKKIASECSVSLEKINQIPTRLDEEISSLTKERDSFKLIADELKKDLEGERSKERMDSSEITSLKEQLDRVQTTTMGLETEMIVLKIAKDKLDQDFKNLQSLHDTTAKQLKAKSKKLEETETSFAEFRKKNAVLQSQSDKLSKTVSDHEKEISLNNAKILLLQKELHEKKGEISKLLKLAPSSQQEIDELKKKIDLKDRLESELKTKTVDLIHELDEMTAKYKNSELKVSELNKKLDKLQKDFDSISLFPIDRSIVYGEKLQFLWTQYTILHHLSEDLITNPDDKILLPKLESVREKLKDVLKEISAASSTPTSTPSSTPTSTPSSTPQISTSKEFSATSLKYRIDQLLSKGSPPITLMVIEYDRLFHISDGAGPGLKDLVPLWEDADTYFSNAAVSPEDVYNVFRKKVKELYKKSIENKDPVEIIQVFLYFRFYADAIGDDFILDFDSLIHKVQKEVHRIKGYGPQEEETLQGCLKNLYYSRKNIETPHTVVECVLDGLADSHFELCKFMGTVLWYAVYAYEMDFDELIETLGGGVNEPTMKTVLQKLEETQELSPHENISYDIISYVRTISGKPREFAIAEASRILKIIDERGCNHNKLINFFGSVWLGFVFENNDKIVKHFNTIVLGKARMELDMTSWKLLTISGELTTHPGVREVMNKISTFPLNDSESGKIFSNELLKYLDKLASAMDQLPGHQYYVAIFLNKFSSYYHEGVAKIAKYKKELSMSLVGEELLSEMQMEEAFPFEFPL